MEKDSTNAIQGIEAMMDVTMNYNTEDVKAQGFIVKTGSMMDGKVTIAIGGIFLIAGLIMILKNKKVL